MKVYLCGPMTGIKQFNIPAFDEAAKDLRRRGYDVVSPAELDDPQTRAAALLSPDGAPGTGTSNGETWGDFLARDVKLIADDGIEAIVCLNGWEGSRGARLETFVARLCGLPIYRYDTMRHVGMQDVADAHGAAPWWPHPDAFHEPLPWAIEREPANALADVYYEAIERAMHPVYIVETEAQSETAYVADYETCLANEGLPVNPPSYCYHGEEIDGHMHFWMERESDEPANPKDAQALRDNKVPLDLLEPAANREIAQALKGGADKYGRRNFIDPSTPIRATSYIAAVRRHIDAWQNGEDFDPDTGLSHWAHVGANVHVMLAAMAAGTFIDDRMPEKRTPEQQAASDRSNAGRE